MPVKAVVDTNIWVSSLLGSSNAARLVDEWRAGKFIVLTSERQIIEIYEVLTRPKFLLQYGISEKEVTDLVVYLKDTAERVPIKGTTELCRDPDDNIIIETAVRGKAKYLITGDKDLTDDKGISSYLSRHSVSIVSLLKFLALIKKI